MALFCVGGLVGGLLAIKKVKRLALLFTAGIFLFAGFIAASFSRELLHFYVFYGVFCGFGVGLSYNVIISSLTKLFPKKQGLISGILMMSFGFGGLILGSVCSKLLVVMGWRSTFRVIGLLMGIIIIVGATLMQVFEKSLGNQAMFIEKIKGENDLDAEEKQKITAIEFSNDLSSKAMVKSQPFRVFFVWLVLISAAGLMIIGHMAPCVLELGGSAATAALAVGIVSIFNGAGRVAFGISYDKIGMIRTLWLINGFLLLAGIILALAVGTRNIQLLLVGCAFMGISYAGGPVSSSAVVHRLFGLTYFSGNFSVASTNLLIGALIGPTLAASLQSRTGSYQTSFFSLVIIGFITLLLCLFLTKNIKAFLNQQD